MKSCKNGQVIGVLCRDVGTPRRSEGPRHDVACPHRGVAEKRIFPSSGSPRRSHCSQHGKLLCFGYVLLFRISKDSSIGLMRTL